MGSMGESCRGAAAALIELMKTFLSLRLEGTSITQQANRIVPAQSPVPLLKRLLRREL